jgi:diguanylate cyclase (GGDEF)-like protein
MDDRSVDQGALARGAYGFLVKGDLTVEGLERSIRYALNLHRRERSLARDAMFDPLTGLPNRNAFFERLTRAVADGSIRSGMIGVALINLNGTKFINEAFGHKIGDEVLRGVAAKLKATKRPIDVLARWGGDEFAIMMTDVLLMKDVVAIARALTEAITTTIDTNDGGHDVTVATGVAGLTATRDKGAAETLAEKLMQQASHGMFRAKQSTRMRGISDIAIAQVH